MSTYKEIKGFKVQTLASDTTASGISNATWASGGALPVALSYGGQAGTQTAGFIFGGSHSTPPSPQFQTESYNYNGTAWTDASADISTGRESAAAAGTSTSALFFAGSSKVDLVESYNGSSWSETTELNTGRDNAFGFGQSSTAAVCAGGRASPSPDAVDLTEVWNGSAWTEVNEMNATKKYGGATGTTTAGAIAGGGDSGEGVPITAQTEEWDGTSWSEKADLNLGRDYAGGTGTQTEFLFYGGINPPAGSSTAATEFYNGTSWTELNDMSTGRMYMYSGSATGSAEAGLAVGGNPYSTATEEFTAPTDFTKQNLGQVYFNSGSNAFKVTKTVFGTGAFSAGGALPTVKSAHGFAGTQTAGVAFAGATSPTNKVATSYEYNGSAWSDANSVNTTRDLCAGAGTQTAGILFGGTLPPGGHSTATELYDGTNWTTSPGTLNHARSRIGPLGTQTAALAVSGTPISPVDKAVESWNGSSWTEIAEINTSRINGGAAGIQTAGLFFGGEDPLRALTEKWNGSSWTEVGDMNTARQSSGMGAGTTNTAAMAIGGEVSPGFTANAETYNGSTWTEVANLGTARGYHACGGVQTTAIATGGRTPPYVANTEEWTVPATTTNTTITVS